MLIRLAPTTTFVGSVPMLGLLGVAFLLASMPPEEYAPFLLDNDGQTRTANRFGNQTLGLLSEFEKVEPIQHTITEKDMIPMMIRAVKRVAPRGRSALRAGMVDGVSLIFLFLPH